MDLLPALGTVMYIGRMVQSGIAEYWVIDLQNRQLHIFRNPTPTGYGSHLILREANQASPLAFPDLAVRLEMVLPPIA